LKLGGHMDNDTVLHVAPRAGAWIETYPSILISRLG